MTAKPPLLSWRGPDAEGVLRLSGELTAFTAPRQLLRPRAFPRGKVRALDLAGLTHLDLNGAAYLFALRRALSARAGAGTGSAGPGGGAPENVRPGGGVPESAGPGGAGPENAMTGGAGPGGGTPEGAGPEDAGGALPAAGRIQAGPELRGLPEALLPVWRLAEDSFAAAGSVPPPHRRGPVERVGEAVAGLLADVRDLLSFLGETAACLAGAAARPWTARWGEASFQAGRSVVDALPVTSLVAFLVGLILAFQAAMQMQMFGVDIYVADLVGISVIRELGTLLTAIVLAGRSGSAFSAELASMKINQEIDAVQTMGLSPARDLALPRILALTFAAPLLTVLADLAGLLGGNVVMMTLGYPFMVFWDELSGHLDLSDVATGLFKSFVFGFTVALIGCQRGLFAGDSPGAVGEATTSGVVTNIIAIAVLDSLFAVLFYALSW